MFVIAGVPPRRPRSRHRCAKTTTTRCLKSDGCKGVIVPIQDLPLTALAATAAYYANHLSDNATRGDYLAKGYCIAIVLVPLIQAISPRGGRINREEHRWLRNCGSPLVDGVGAVFKRWRSPWYSLKSIGSC